MHNGPWRAIQTIAPLAAFTLIGLGAALPAHASEVRAVEFNSPSLGRNLSYNVYLPTGYEANQNTRYPVMYLLHGNAGNRNDWVVKGKMQGTVDRLVAQGDIPPAIYVMPDANTNWYVDLKEKMESAFFNDLMPHVEKTYRTINTRDGRVIGGLSMGAMARCATCSSTRRSSRPRPCSRPPSTVPSPRRIHPPAPSRCLPSRTRTVPTARRSGPSTTTRR